MAQLSLLFELLEGWSFEAYSDFAFFDAILAFMEGLWTNIQVEIK